MKKFDHTILLAHGSRDKRWAKPFETIINEVSGQHSAVSLAFMELSSPTLEEAITTAYGRGAKDIAILPLFFAAGKHLREDVPGMIESISAPLEARIELLPPIGEHPEFLRTVTNIVGDLLTSR